MSDYQSLPLNPTNGRYEYEHGGVTYQIAPKLMSEDLAFPGINISFADPIDVSTDRLRTKRFVWPVIVIVTRPLEAVNTALYTEQTTYEICDILSDILGEGCTEIWDYSQTPAVSYGKKAYWLGSDFSWIDDSLVFEGGDIRFSLGLELEYVEPKSLV